MNQGNTCFVEQAVVQTTCEQSCVLMSASSQSEKYSEFWIIRVNSIASIVVHHSG